MRRAIRRVTKGLGTVSADVLTAADRSAGSLLHTGGTRTVRGGRELRARIKRAFDAEGIEIPFPQRTVWHRGDDDLVAAHGEK